MTEFTDNQDFYVYPHSQTNQQLMRGVLRPVRVRAMPCDTCVVTVDSKDRISGTDYNFTVNLQKAIIGPLKAQVSRASIPKIPNINANDNVITIIHESLGVTGPVSVTMPIGYYNQNSLITTMQNSINTGMTGIDVFTVAFDTSNKSISIESNTNKKWYISNQCSFAKYGSNVANFPAYDPTTDPLTLNTSKWYSGNAGLLYSRYVAISSNILCSHAYETSRTTRGLFNTVATISMVNQYDTADFSVNGVYEGNLLMDSTVEVSSIINIAQSGSQLQILDFKLTDEYGFDIGTSISLGSPYNTSELGCIIWVTIYL